MLLTWVSYWPCLWGGYIWDDNSYVLYNRLLQDGAGLWRIWFDPMATPQYHPLVFTTYWIEYQLWGAHTLGYHAVNVLLHTAASLALWRLLCQLGVPGAVVAAGVFALHPVHVESVAWITERKDVLSALFYALAMIWWLRFVSRERERDWMLALLFGACTLLSKTVLCTFPAAMALLAWWKAPRRWRFWGVRLLPFVLISMPIAWLTVWREHSHGNPPLPFTLLERGLIAARALSTHVASLVWPVDLTIVYAHWEVSAVDPLAYLHPLAWISVFVVLVALRERIGSGALVAVSFFVVTLAPMLGLVDYNIMRYAFVADHFQYVASAGLIALAAAAGERWTRNLASSGRGALAATLLAVLAVLSWRQAGLYVSADVIWRDNLVKNPRSWVAYSYHARQRMEAGDGVGAAEILYQATAAMPEHLEAHRTLGIVLGSLDRNDEALTQLRRAVAIDPANAVARQSLGVTLLSLGRVEEAAAELAEAVRLRPAYAEAWRYRAVAAARLGRQEEAVAHLEEALRVRPDFPEARAELDALRGQPP